MKIVLSTLSAIIIVAFAIPIIGGILLHSTTIQNMVVGRLTTFASEYTGTEISIGRVDIKLINRASVSDIFIRDMQGDTLLYARELTVGVKGFNIFSGNIALGRVVLDSACFYLQKDSAGVMNLKYLTNFLKSKNPKPATKPFMLTAAELKLVDTRFKLRAYQPQYRPNGINFQDLKVDNINLRAKNIEVIDDSISLELRNLNFKEKSGIQMKHLSAGDINISSTGLRFDGLNIETNFSNLNFRRFDMLYPKWSAFQDFSNDVVFDADIVSSILSYNTLQIFIPRKMDIASHIVFSGTVYGPLSSMEGRLNNIVTKDSRMSIGFNIKGLPNIKNTVFELHLRDLMTDSKDILSIYSDITGKSLDNIAPMLERMGEIRLEADFAGHLNDFKASSILQISQGKLDMDFNIKPLDKSLTRFIGRLKTTDFGVGSLLASRKLGAVTLDSEVDGIAGPDSVTIQTKGDIKSLYFNGYRYNSITVNGRFGPKSFNGYIGSDDPNINFDLNGRFNFRGKIPTYDFDMQLANADLKKLNFVTKDSISILRSNLVAHAAGNNIDNINGNITINNLLYINPIDTVKAGPIYFTANNNDDRKVLKIESPFADITLQGKYGFRDLIGHFSNTLKLYLPSLPENAVPPTLAAPISSSDADRYYMLTVNVKKANNVAGIFVPGLNLAEGTKATFLFNPESNQFSLSLRSDFVECKSLLLSELSVDSWNLADSVALYVKAADMYVGNTEFPNFSIIGGIRDNIIGLGTRFNNKETGTQALISTTSTIRRSATGIPQLNIHFNPTTFTVERQTWQISATDICLDTTGYDFRGFQLRSGPQTVAINGKMSKEINDSLKVSIRNFSIKPFSNMLKSVGMVMDGTIHGDAVVRSALSDPLFVAGIQISDFSLNNKSMGSPIFISDWDKDRQRIQFLLKKDDGKAIFAGTYIPKTKRYIATIDIPNVDVSLLDSLLSGILADNRGMADAKLTLSGIGNKPALNGTVNIRDFATRIDFTNTNYFVDKAVMTITNNQFEIKGAELRDEGRGRGTLDFRMRSTYLKDMAIEVDAKVRNMRCLNTSIKDNPLFYGRVNATGEVFVRNYNRSTSMKVVATTDNDSEFFLPLSSSETISEADFITFVDAKTRSEAQKRRMLADRHPRLAIRDIARRQRPQSDMNIDMLLNVKPNAEMQIVIDPKVGDVIRGRGDGTIKLNINPTKDLFSMYGSYQITQGTYLFTLQNIINKRFVIEEGGSIQWTGDPVNPMLNIAARYEVKTPLSPLLGSSDQYNRNTNVYCVINLSDKLLQPVVKLDITVPNADPETASRVANALNTEENMSTQFMYLLMLNSFNPEGGFGNSSSSNIGAMYSTVTGLEFLTNQISNWISSDKMDMRFRYRPKGDMTSDEVELMFATDIVKNKLSIEVDGNYDFGNNQSFVTPTANKLYGDIYLTYYLNDSRTLSIKGFTRTIDRFDETQGLQESGAGIYYRKDFNTFKEWLAEMRRKKEVRRENKTEKKEQAKPADELVTFGKDSTAVDEKINNQ